MKYIELKDDEQIIRIVRAAPVTLVPRLVIGIFLIFMPIFLFIPLFAFGIPGVILFWFSLALGIIWSLHALLLWRANQTIITNKRIVDVYKKRLFDVVVSESNFYQIEDISYQKKGLVQHMLNFGAVRITLKDSKVNLELRRIHKPAYVHTLLMHLRNIARGAETSTLERMIDKFKELDEVERKALIHTLQEMNGPPSA